MTPSLKEIEAHGEGAGVWLCETHSGKLGFGTFEMWEAVPGKKILGWRWHHSSMDPSFTAGQADWKFAPVAESLLREPTRLASAWTRP